MPVLIEVNSGREPQKDGALPEKTRLALLDQFLLDWFEQRGARYLR
jgi:hypothetical protein